ncbi:MAG: carboxynorspermidine decarboxylase [Elusimicrobia bacterium]|nr:carboxynorspermidine decarboxylase [Elusimicrobiota bacterium]MBD3412191.1 carboxynorspermidine decarboxylase [Elusimicrobiota bacterium]
MKSTIKTPYYLIDEKKVLKNLKRIKTLRTLSGAQSVLALKCFATWALFDFMRPYIDGTTSSSLYEARLGYEKFGKEVHAYSVAFADEDIGTLKKISSKIIFNSISQLERYRKQLSGRDLGLRVNPKISHSEFDLADPARRYSRLGVTDYHALKKMEKHITGIMFHCNCENDNYAKLSLYIDHIARRFGKLLSRLQWVSLGGGIYFTKDGFPLHKFAQKLRDFSRAFDVQVYLEPGETVVTGAGYLKTKVLDIVQNEIDIAIVDSSTEAHMLDLLVYRTPAKIEECTRGRHRYMIAGKSCLAGDIFGIFNFKSKLQIGSIISIGDAAGYTMVKKNWFNGLSMPAIAIKKLNGSLVVVKKFNYSDYTHSLS